MLTKFLSLLACVTFALNTTPIYAGNKSNEYSGVYVLEGLHAPVTAGDRDVLRLKCILAPVFMNEDGTGTSYFLDRDKFQSNGTISYIRGHEYKCRYSPDTHRESCDSKQFSEGTAYSYHRENIYTEFTPQLQRGNSLITPEDEEAWRLRRELNPKYAFAFHRCHCLSSWKFRSLVSPEANSLSSERTIRLLYWWIADPSTEDMKTARRILSISGLCDLDSIS